MSHEHHHHATLLDLTNGGTFETARAIEASTPVELFKTSNPATAVHSIKVMHEMASASDPLDTRWLPFAAEAYGISPNLKDYAIVPVVIMASNLPNRNLVAFPFNRLTEFNVPTGKLAYKTWQGQPLFVDHCFPAGTMVLTSEGEKRIENIRIGDMVVTHRGRLRRVSKTFNNGVKPLMSLSLKGRVEPIQLTSNHPVLSIPKVAVKSTLAADNTVAAEGLVGAWWVDAGVLHEGDSVVLPRLGVETDDLAQSILGDLDYINQEASGTHLSLTIASIDGDTGEGLTYNLEVEEDNSYVASGICVHNCNNDHTKAKGVVLDVSMRPINGVHGDIWRVETLCAFDRTRDPRLVASILDGSVNSYSMGAIVQGYTCSICGAETKAPVEPPCSHIPANRKTLNSYSVGGKQCLAFYYTGPMRGFEVSALVRALPGAFPSTDNTGRGISIDE